MAMRHKVGHAIDRLCAFNHCNVFLPWFTYVRASDDVAWLRRLACQLEGGPEHTPLASAPTMVAAAVIHGLRGLRDIGINMQTHSEVVRQRYGVGRGQQFTQLLRAVFRYNFSAGQYYKLRLCKLPQSRWSQLLDHRETTLLMVEVARRAGVDELWTKNGWESFGTTHNLPIVKACAVIQPGVPVSPEDVAALRPGQDYFFKPDIGFSSKGNCLLTWDPAQGLWDIHSGCQTAVTPANLAAFLGAQASLSQTPLVIQPRIRNHPDLADLSPQALANARVTTVRGRDNEIRIMHASLRFPVIDHHASDYPGLTVCAPIDPLTGELSRCTSSGARLDECTVHPRFGTQIEGRVMTQWPEITRLVKRAHQLVPQMPVIAWDAIPQMEGPLLLEANAAGGGYLLQHHGSMPVGETEWPGAVRDWLESTEQSVTNERNEPPGKRAGEPKESACKLLV